MYTRIVEPLHLTVHAKPFVDSLGLQYIDGFLDGTTHLHTKELISNSQFRRVFQSRESHYKHVFHSESDVVTGPEEPYLASFDICTSHDTNTFLAEVLLKRIAEPLRNINNQLRFFTQPALIRLCPSSFYRVHVDDYAGCVGYTLFLNDGWKWDYGGILTYISKDGSSSYPIFPSDNRVLIRDETLRSFHYVTQQAIYSTDYQYLILGWADSILHESTHLRRYIEL